MACKRHIEQNIWGNWKGYLGTKCVIEFGTDNIAAGHWLLTGETERNAGYAPSNFEAARIAALKS